MSNEFYTILTDAGLVAIANASVSSSTVNFAKVMVGDGNGSYYTPTKDMNALRNKKWEGPVASVEIDPTNSNWVTVEAVIPATDGGFYIREIGIANEAGTLLAIGKLPETYKPALDSGSTKDLYLRAIFEASNASVITLRTDPSTVLASRKYVDDKVSNIVVPVIVDNLNSTATDKVLSAKQGKVIKELIEAKADDVDLTQLQTEFTQHLDQKGQPNGYASLSAEGKVPLEQLPPITDVQDATLTQKGITMLSNAIDSDDETTAVTPKALNTVRKAAVSNHVDVIGGDPNTPTKAKMLTNTGAVPVANTYFYIETTSYGDENSMNYSQTARGYLTDVMYTRNKYWQNANWSPWVLVYTTANITTSNAAPPTNLPTGYIHQVYV